MAMIGQAVSEEKIFEIVDDRRTLEPSAQVSLKEYKGQDFFPP